MQSALRLAYSEFYHSQDLDRKGVSTGCWSPWTLPVRLRAQGGQGGDGYEGGLAKPLIAKEGGRDGDPPAPWRVVYR